MTLWVGKKWSQAQSSQDQAGFGLPDSGEVPLLLLDGIAHLHPALVHSLGRGGGGGFIVLLKEGICRDSPCATIVLVPGWETRFSSWSLDMWFIAIC